MHDDLCWLSFFFCRGACCTFCWLGRNFSCKTRTGNTITVGASINCQYSWAHIPNIATVSYTSKTPPNDIGQFLRRLYWLCSDMVDCWSQPATRGPGPGPQSSTIIYGVRVTPRISSIGTSHMFFQAPGPTHPSCTSSGTILRYKRYLQGSNHGLH